MRYIYDAVHGTIKMKPIEVTDDYYAEYNENSMHSNKKDPKFKVGDYVRVSKYKNYKNILLKEILEIGQKKFLLLIK